MAFMLYLGDLYHAARRASARRDLIARVLICQAAAALVLAAVGFAVPPAPAQPLGVPADLILTTPGSSSGGPRSSAAWSQQQMTVRVLVLGTGQVGRLIAGLEPTSARPFRIIGFLDDAPGRRRHGAGRVRAAREDPGSRQPGGGDPPRHRGHRPDGSTRAASRPRRCWSAACAGIRVEDWPTFYEKADRQDPGHRRAPELADLLRRLRQDAAHRDHQAALRHHGLAGRARPVPAAHGPRRHRGQAGVARARSSTASPAWARTAACSSSTSSARCARTRRRRPGPSGARSGTPGSPGSAPSCVAPGSTSCPSSSTCSSAT